MQERETDRNGDTWGQQTGSGGRDSIENEKRMYGKRHTSRATESVVSSYVGPGQYWLWSNGLQPMTGSRLGTKQGFPLAYKNPFGPSCGQVRGHYGQLTQIDKETGDKSTVAFPSLTLSTQPSAAVAGANPLASVPPPRLHGQVLPLTAGQSLPSLPTSRRSGLANLISFLFRLPPLLCIEISIVLKFSSFVG